LLLLQDLWQTSLYARDAEIDSELMAALERWETLSAK
jgi:hypothetical protein